MSDLERFAKILCEEADELADYSRRLARAAGGKETEDSEWCYRKSSVLSEVAKAAMKACDQTPEE